MFKKVATLQFRKIYASDSNGNYYWRDFVKEANSKLATDANFVPKSFYEYDTKNFLYITARAISGMEKWGCNGNFDAFPWEELKKSYATFCGKGFYIEHKEDDEKDAKGIILDAQPDDDNEFINCICAISKEEYPEICDDILNGKLNQVSMSCLAGTCGCSLCGNEATKEEELCEHMNPKHPNFCKGQTNSNGQPIYEINKDIMFTGLSGVAVPADKDAFIFDVKASKKQNGKTINKEYNKYCRAKKEYEYINSLLEKKDTRKYIESQLKKAFQDIKGESWEEVLDNIQKAGYDFDEHYYDEPYHFIKALKDNKEYEIELFGYHNGSYEVIGIGDTGRTYKDFGDFIVNSSLKKKAILIGEDDPYEIEYNELMKQYSKEAENFNSGTKEMYELNKKYTKLKNDLKQKYKKVSLNKKAGKFVIQDVESGMYFNNDDLVESQNEAQIFNTREEAENEIDRRMHKIINKMQDKERKLEPINSEDYYDVIEITASLNKKADIEYISDTIKEIPPIDFETEFMLAGKSKGVNTDINKDQLEIGIKVEMEHTTNPVIAEKIAMDHIKEIPNYYTLLAEMEAKAKFEFEQAKDIINKETNEELPTKLASKQFFKVNKSSKQFFKVNKASKQWFKIANIYDDPEERNNIDNYGLSELQRKELQNVIDHIDIVNEDIVVTWDELVESVNQDILDYDFMNKNKVNIMDYIENELGQKIEAY